MLATCAALTAFLVLAASGTSHLRSLASFRMALRSQGVWPSRAVGLVAVSVAGVEGALGAGGLAAVATGSGAIQVVVLAAAGALYLTYAGYGLYLLRSRPGVPCACSHDLQPIDQWVVARAAALAAVVAASVPQTPVADGLAANEVVVASLAAVGYALLTWSLPSALRDPLSTSRLEAPAGGRYVA